MAHYQRREWQEALDYFQQLKEVEPNWTGLDSLIDEASWFLQLESVEARPGQAPAEESSDVGTWPIGRAMAAASGCGFGVGSVARMVAGMDPRNRQSPRTRGSLQPRTSQLGGRRL